MNRRDQAFVSAAIPWATARSPNEGYGLLARIADGFDPTSTDDPVLFSLHCSSKQALPDRNVVSLLRLHLQKGHWNWLLASSHDAEVTALSAQCDHLISWLLSNDKSVEHRAGCYLTQKLNSYAPLDFAPESFGIAGKIAHLYHIYEKAFFYPECLEPPTKSVFQIHIVTFLKWHGGQPWAVKPVKIERKCTWGGLKHALSEHTNNVQVKQMGFPEGFQCTGVATGHWEYVVDDYVTDLSTFNKLSCDADWNILKKILRSNHRVTIIHRHQRNIRVMLVLADAEHADVKPRNTPSLAPIPASFIPSVAPRYPYPMAAAPLIRHPRALIDAGLLRPS